MSWIQSMLPLLHPYIIFLYLCQRIYNHCSVPCLSHLAYNSTEFNLYFAVLLLLISVIIICLMETKDNPSSKLLLLSAA
jgi:hypothetical protein